MLTADFDPATETFFETIDGNVRDYLEVEVGDAKQDQFGCGSKVKRWHNHCNVSIHIPDMKGKLRRDKETAKFRGDGREAQFRTIAPNPFHPAGGIETDLLILEKPGVNSFPFTLNYKNIEFVRQPPLTQEEILLGASRPANIDGSYALFTTGPQINIDGGMLWRAGKFGHLVRPPVIDADGVSVLADLRIESGVLWVDVVPGFMESARFPVLIDPTFGFTTQGGTAQSVSANQYHSSLFTSPSDVGAASMISFYALSAAGTNAKGIIHLHSDLTLVSAGSAVSIPAGGSGAWRDSTLSPTLTAAIDYLLGSIYQGNAVTYYDTGSTDQGHNGSNTYSTPGTLVSPTHTTRKYSVYITYTSNSFPRYGDMFAVL